MTISAPQLDTRDEDEVTATVIDDLPAELTDRNRSSLVVELVEACGTYYGKLMYLLNQWPKAVEYRLLKLLGVEPTPATFADVPLTFVSSADAPTSVIVPAGTVIKTGAGDDAVEFATDVDVEVPSAGGTAAVSATALLAGSLGNVVAGSLILFDAPVANIASVTNLVAASGGQDEESFVSMQLRSRVENRVQNRIVVDEDAELVATSVDGALRAKAIGATYFNGTFSTAAGARAVAIVDTNLNQGANPTLLADVKAAIEAKDFPGTNTVVHRPDVRLLYVTNVSLVLDGTKKESEVEAAVLAALEQYFTAFDIFDADGTTLISPGWEWGERMHAYEVISMIDRVAGVKRVSNIHIDYSDDYGSNWQVTPVPLTDLEPGPFGTITDMWGLMHWGGDYSPPVAFGITVL